MAGRSHDRSERQEARSLISPASHQRITKQKSMKRTTNIDLASLVGQEDRDLLVTGMQALWRERVAAWNTASNFAAQHDREAPDREAFGIDEASEMLRRLGAAPSSF